MSKHKNVTVSEARAWLASDEGQDALTKAGVDTKVGTRGRLNPAQVEVFHKSNKNKRVTLRANGEPKPAHEQPNITVPVVGLDSIGRKVTRQVTLTTAEARALLGQPTSTKGRISHRLVSEALSAQAAADVADQFTKDA